MAIGESQLQIWTNAPASAKSQYTYEQVKRALAQSPYEEIREIDPFLQGSYANSTNIKADSDIDIVCRTKRSFNADRSLLPPQQQTSQIQTFGVATYSWQEFKRQLTQTLANYFGVAYVQAGNKSIKILPNDQRAPADILAGFEHKKYLTFSPQLPNNYIEGVTFWTSVGNLQIINFPKIHLENGENKNHSSRTNDKYKHAIRIFKNLRKQLVEQYNFDKSLAPSYFLECAIYNVPDNYFNGSYQNITANVLQYLLRECNANSLLTVSHQHLLFGSESWQWNIANASTFLTQVESLYHHGR